MVNYSKLVRIYDVPHIDLDFFIGESVEETADRLLSIRKLIEYEIKKNPKTFKTPIQDYHRIEVEVGSWDDVINFEIQAYRLKTKEELAKEKEEEKKERLRQKRNKLAAKRRKEKREYQIYLKIKNQKENVN